MAWSEWNSADKDVDIIISGTDNEIITCSSGSKGCRGTLPKSTGKFYTELEFTDINTVAYETELGIATSSAGLANIAGASSYAWVADISSGDLRKVSNNSGTVIISGSYGDGSILMIAVDLDAGKVWFGINGTWSGDPAAGTGEAFSSVTISGNNIYLIGSVSGGVTPTMGTMIPNPANHTYSVPSGFTEGWGDSTIYEGTITAGLGASDGLGDNLGLILGSVGAAETLSGFVQDERMQFDIGASAAISAARYYEKSISDESVVGESISVLRDTFGILSSNAGMGELIEGFNLTEFLRINSDYIVNNFIFILSGLADGRTNVEIPIKTLRAAGRETGPTEVFVTVPYSYLSQITARSNGEMLIWMTYNLAGTELFRETILVVDFESYTTSNRPKHQFITIKGSRTESRTAKTATLSDISYETFSAGKVRYRAAIDTNIRPGDTINAGEIDFIAGLVSYTINKTNRLMEIGEA